MKKLPVVAALAAALAALLYLEGDADGCWAAESAVLDADPESVFGFLMHPDTVETWFRWISHFRSADMKPLGPGKRYLVTYTLPALGKALDRHTVPSSGSRGNFDRFIQSVNPQPRKRPCPPVPRLRVHARKEDRAGVGFHPEAEGGGFFLPSGQREEDAADLPVHLPQDVRPLPVHAGTRPAPPRPGTRQGLAGPPGPHVGLRVPVTSSSSDPTFSVSTVSFLPSSVISFGTTLG